MAISTRSEAVEKAALARRASRRMASLSTGQKDEALERIADALVAEAPRILEVNAGDIERGRAKGLSESFVDRMVLNEQRVAGIARDTRAVVGLPDPVGETIDMSTRPNGLQIGRIRVPLGVVGAIYESRPNVTVDIAAICLKSGNAVVLRSGSDAHATSSVLAGIVASAAEESGLPGGAFQFIESTDRDEVGAMLRAHDSIDLLIPRGGSDLIRRVRDEALMPVVTGGIGVCHTYIDANANIEMATNIVINAKTARQLGIEPLQYAQPELAFAFHRHDAGVRQLMLSIRLELDALLEVDEVQLHLVGREAKRHLHDEDMQERRFARARLARDEHVLRGSLP